MKIYRAVLLVFLLFVVSDYVLGQQLMEDEVVVIQGEKFVLHQVRTGETVFSLTQQFGVDSLALTQNNLFIADGLKIGDVLKIPYRENVTFQQEPVSGKGVPDYFEMHTIESRTETPYFIAKEYGITVEDIYTYNPGVNRFRRGTTLRIPVWAPKQAVQQNSEVEQSDEVENEFLVYEVQPGETLSSIARKLNIQEEQISVYNPGSENPRPGVSLYLPKDAVVTIVPGVSDDGVANYFEHTIESGETMWGITHQYNVSETELKALNPLLETSFPAGAVIKIPVRDTNTIPVQPRNEDAFEKYVVQKGETLYGLSMKFDLKISEIKKFNPVLETRNLLRGETILIPRMPEQLEMVEETEEQTNEETVDSVAVSPDYYDIEIPKQYTVEIPESCKPQEFGMYSFGTYNIALFLPLFIEANDTINKEPLPEEIDSLVIAGLIDLGSLDLDVVRGDQFNGFYRNSESFIQFYEGVLLAVDSMQNAGMNIRLTVYDTQNDPDTVRKYFLSDGFLATDLIIGPVYPNVQGDIAALAAKNGIPMVSPLSAQSNELHSNPYFYQVNPEREYLSQKTAELVAEEYFNSNFIVFKTSPYRGTPEGDLVNLIQEKLFNSGYLEKAGGVNFSVYDFENDGPFGLRRVLSKTKENVIYIPSSTEGEVSVAISNINNLADDYPITVIGTNRFKQYESIEVDQFHNLKLEYIAPYWVDYNDPATVNVIEKFKRYYYTEPNDFGMQGYDITFYFLNALRNYGRDFSECLPYLKLDLLQGDYHFEKVSQFGGYMNRGVSVIEYQRDYDVVRKRIEGQLNLASN